MKKGDVIYVKQGPDIVGRGVVKGTYKFDPNCKIIYPNDLTLPFAHQVPVDWEANFRPFRLLLGAEPSTVLELSDERLNRLESAMQNSSISTTTAHLVVAQGNHREEFRQEARKGHVNWSCTQRFKKGDLAFFYFAAPYQEIVGIGQVSSTPETKDGEYGWTRRNKVSFCDFSPIMPLPAPIYLPEICRGDRRLSKWYSQRPMRNTRTVPSEVTTALIEVIRFHNPNTADFFTKALFPKTSNNFDRPGDTSLYREGNVLEITQELIVRDRRLREDAVKTKGCICEVCGFSFSNFYGEIGDGFIEVHHLRQLSSLRGRVVKTTLRDVAVVCSNCHRMLHRNGTSPLATSELKKMIESHRKKRN